MTAAVTIAAVTIDARRQIKMLRAGNRTAEHDSRDAGYRRCDLLAGPGVGRVSMSKSWGLAKLFCRRSV